jgi:hypothetical protein
MSAADNGDGADAAWSRIVSRTSSLMCCSAAVPVHALARWVQRVQQLLESLVWHRLEEVSHRRTEGAQRLKQLLTIGARSIVEGDDDHNRQAIGRGSQSAYALALSGAVCVKSRKRQSTSRAIGHGQINSPPKTIGPTWWRRNSKEVTIPKLPSPPRTPQKRSAFSSALAVRN